MPTLKELREAAVLSQKDLARLSGVGRTTISAIENARRRRKPHPSTMRKLARALRVKPQVIEI